MGSYAQDIDRIVKSATAQGFEIKRTNNGHVQFYAPNRRDIVTSSRSGNGHGWENFMSQMRRAGFQEATTSVGDALRSALDKANTALQPPPVEPAEPQTIRELILDLLGRHPHGLPLADIEPAIKSRRTVASNSIAAALSTMKGKGELTAVGRGYYKLTPAPAPVPPPPTPHAASALTGDPKIDADLAVLDSSLAALAAIEGVVRRTRDKLFDIAQFKRKLNDE